MRERRNSFSHKWIGISLIVGIIVSLLTRSIEYALSYRAVIIGKLDYDQYNRRTFYSTTFDTMFYLMNLIIVGLLFVYFFYNRNQEKSQKEQRIGFAGSVSSLVIHIVTIILYIIAEVQIYNTLIKPGILKAQLSFSIFYFVSYFIVLVIFWKIVFHNKTVNSITKILSLSLIAFGLCIFLIAMDPMSIFSLLKYPGTGRSITLRFFNYIFNSFYAVLAVMAGTVIILVSKQKDDLI